MNFSTNGAVTPDNDPLGLRQLAAPKPESGTLEDDWKVISAALDAQEARDKSRRQWWIGGLAAAATVAFVLIVASIPPPETTGEIPVNDIAAETIDPIPPEGDSGSSSVPETLTTDELIAMSQKMERQLHQVRSQVGGMPSELVIFQVELQDLIGQVDDALSMSPGSQTLWGQRLGLQMDLMKLYRNQLRRDYHRLASV